MIDYPNIAWVYNCAVDMRRSIDGLSMLVQEQISGEQYNDPNKIEQLPEERIIPK